MTTLAWSLRGRLLFWLLLPLSLLGLITWVWSYAETQRRTNAIFDRTLGGSALAIADRVVVGAAGRLDVDIPYVALEMLASAADDRVFYKIMSDTGGLLTGYEGLPVPERLPPIGGDPVFFDATYEGAAIRGAALAGAASDMVRSIGFTVIVAETTQGRQAEIRAALGRSAVRMLLLIAGAALVVWFGVRRGLAPLERLAAAVGRRSPNDLRPIRHETPKEIAGLVDAINAFMARLTLAIASLQRFAGNAGHQLRTPLAVIRANLELARRARTAGELEAALAQAHRATQRAEAVIDQFLLLARLDAAHGRSEAVEPVELNRLAAETARERAPAALRAGLGLEFEPCETGAAVQGNRVLLRELLLNLLNNAILHAAPGRAVVRVRRDADRVVLEVADDGPGLPDAPREAAFDTADTANETAHGRSGLGLAIASEIAGRFGGTLSLAPGAGGRGLTAAAIFPACPADGTVRDGPPGPA